MSSINFSTELPHAPATLFLVGIGGIGMSGLAQLLRHLGYNVAGSDRGLDEPSRAELYNQLRSQGITLFPQDGSGPATVHPDALVLSTAIEADNPDLAAAPDTPRLHRATVMATAFNRLPARQLLVAGSCGKTSVTGWLAAALHALGKSIIMVNGGYTLDFEDSSFPGNFYADNAPEFIVAEIDESDRSIREFTPDCAVVLNVGDDHYSADELRQVFRAFTARATTGAIVPASLQQLLPPNNGRTFAEDAPGYAVTPNGISFAIAPNVIANTTQTGRHSAWNGAAVTAMLRLALPELDDNAIADALGAFRGVRQRFEVVSPAGAHRTVINDYAHNPEKIQAAIAAARERCGSPLAIAFQPHGFGPLGFMRQPLKEHLQQCLKPGDTFVFLPVFYAGGTSSFSPTSDEVAAEYAADGLPVTAAPDRAAATALFTASNANTWLILGARDASLRTWSKELAAIK